MAWGWYSGQACYMGTSGGEVLYQPTVFTVGQIYVVKFVISGQTQGVLTVPSLSGTHSYYGDGVQVAYGTAATTSLIFEADIDSNGNIFNGCVDIVEVSLFSKFSPFATSPCIEVLSDQGCLLLVKATNLNDALGFSWSGLTLIARIDAIFAMVEYKTQLESTVDTLGNKSIIYFDGQKLRHLLVRAAPIWVHDFLYMCMAVDSFNINGIDWVVQDEEYPDITWNSRFLEGTAEIKVRKKVEKLNKTNC